MTRPQDDRLTFGLVHGGAHGGWCWAPLVRELEVLGHRGIAPDLPCEDERAGSREYADVMLEALADTADQVVLIGHSLGGLTLPVVAGERPTKMMIFIAAVLPMIGKSLNEQRETEPEMLFPYTGGIPGLRDRFYNRCSPAVADRAMERLRKQSLKPFVEPTPLTEWPSVSSRYVVCGDDHACNPAWARSAVPTRLGVEPIELADSDHSPFLSTPVELAQLLINLATDRSSQ